MVYIFILWIYIFICSHWSTPRTRFLHHLQVECCRIFAAKYWDVARDNQNFTARTEGESHGVLVADGWWWMRFFWAGKLEIVYLGGEIRCIAWCKGAVVYVNDAFFISSCESLKETLAYFGQCVFIDMYTYTRHIFHLQTFRTTDIHWACFKNSSRDSIAVMSRWTHHCWWWKLNRRTQCWIIFQ